MSFREKSLWVQLLANVGVWGFYFWTFRERMGAYVNLPSFAHRCALMFTTGLILLIIVAAILGILSRMGSTEAERQIRDEREQLANLRAFKWAYVVGGALLLWVGYSLYQAGADLSLRFDRQPVDGGVSMAFLPSMQWVPSTFVVAANHMLLCLVLAEVFRHLLNIVLIRRLR